MQDIGPYGMLNQTDEPIQFGPFSNLDTPCWQWGLQLRDQYDVTDFSWASKGF
jgi:hypothetical protein